MEPQFLNSSTFSVKDLNIIKPPKNPVILKSGGPIMELFKTKNGQAYCEWEDGYAWFNTKCLYKLIEL